MGGSLCPARLWFTIAFGIVNEVCWLRVDLPQIRDLGFVLADDAAFQCEVQRLRSDELATAAPGVPPPCVVHRYPRFTLTLRVVGDPQRDVLLLDVVLESDETLRPYALLAPHLGGTGHDNVADATTRSDSLGFHVARLPTAALDAGRSPDFTWRWEGSGARAGGDCRPRLDGAASAVTSASSRWPRRRPGS